MLPQLPDLVIIIKKIRVFGHKLMVVTFLEISTYKLSKVTQSRFTEFVEIKYMSTYYYHDKK